MIGPHDLRLHQRLLRVDALTVSVSTECAKPKSIGKRTALARRDQRAAGFQELLERVDARLAEAADDVGRLAVHAEEFELVVF